MSSQSQVTVKALGLNINPNFLDLPNGSLVVANDVIIRRENVIESRRGMSNWSEGLGTSLNRTEQLFEYKGRILANYTNKIAFDTGEQNTDGSEIFSDFSGTFSSASNYRMKSIEANKNLYLTTSDGIKKISAATADDFTTASGFIQPAGAIKAIDFTANLDITQGQIAGFLPVDSAVAYRTVWAYKDANDNLILGSPSSRVLVYNFAQNSIVQDFNRLLEILDIFGSTPSPLITSTNFYSTFSMALNPVVGTLQSNVISMATQIDTNLTWGTKGGTGVLNAMSGVQVDSDVVTITFSAGNPSLYITAGDWLNVSGFTAIGADDFSVINGNWQVTAVTAATVKFILINSTTGALVTNPITGIPYTYAAAIPNAGAKLQSYNYRNIINTGDDSFPISLADTSISVPANSGQIATIGDTINRIVQRLKVELPAVITAALITEYLTSSTTPFNMTLDANTDLRISIPTGISSNSAYFLQVYRSNVFTAFTGSQTDTLVLGTTVIPDDELHLVFEQYPTPAEFSQGYIEYHDEYPDVLAQTNTPLYTNPSTGDGILQSNDIPPYAEDINLFKNVVFYANTKTRHTIPNFQLLGVDNITTNDKITIANSSTSSTYTFIDGSKEQTRFTVTAANAAALKIAIQDKYITINNANNATAYYCWFRYDGAGTDPAPSGKTRIIIDLITGDTVAKMCERSADTLKSQIFNFTATFTATTFVVTNINEGITSDATNGTASAAIAVSVLNQGTGEDVANGKVLISRTLSAAQNIDLTARSLIRVINGNSSSPVYAYYTSGDNTSPGQIDLESKVLSDVPFYIIASGPQFNSGTFGIGNSFSPDVSPINVETATTIATDGSHTGYIKFTTTSPHGLQNGDQVVITNTNSTPVVDGVYTVAFVTSTTFDVIHSAIVAGTKFSWELTSDSVVSTNNVSPNRIYYSKFNQPEAVPLLNFFEIGPADKAILRIFPLRNSLMVFKEDALYRISGQVAPFTVQPFDTSCVLSAPDTLDVTDNAIFGWTTKGITSVSESGTNEISKPVDVQILKLASSTYPNFKTITWGFGYNSDYSYTVFTNSDPSDTYATIGFRYSTLTNTWTNIVRTQTCGLVRTTNDLLYMGSGDENIINQERKSFTRTDYADKDFPIQLNNNSLFVNDTVLQFTDVSEIVEGDVLLQDQYVTVYNFNSALQKLDLDPTVGLNTISSSSGSGTTITITTTAPHNLTNGDYVVISETDSVALLDGTYAVSNVTSLTFDITVTRALRSQTTAGKVKRSYYLSIPAISGENLRSNILELAGYLDTDPGLSGTNYASSIANKTGSITKVDITNPTILTSAAHGLVEGRVVTIAGTASPATIPDIDGTYAVSGITLNTFTIPVDVTTGSNPSSGLTFSTASNLSSFLDIMACFNELMTLLNNDSGATYSNYTLISTSTPFEAVVSSVNYVSKKVTLNIPLPWIVGPIQVYKAIPCEVLYSPLTFGDPLKLKQIYQATAMFSNTAFTKASLSFSSDLKPEFTEIKFSNLGNGIFGSYSNPGFGFGYFGGAGNSKPFRTLIPLQNQRCRYINVKFDHMIAREFCELYGVTLTGNVGESERGYR